MVKVIDSLEEAGVIRFSVDRSFHDHNLILGKWQHAVDEHGHGSVGQNEFRGSAESEYQRVCHWAAQHGVQFVWVHDRNGLFPLAKRPEIAG